jgi:alanine racemase
MGCLVAAAAVFPDEAFLSPELRIHRSALEHNLIRFRQLAPRSKILLPVKANAYGCGIRTLFPFFNLAAIDMLGVANTGEAAELRRLGWQKPVLNLGGFFPENIPEILAERITVSLTDLWQVEALDRAAKAPVSAHIKLDLGMGRIGLRPEQLPAFIESARGAKHLRIEGIFTHFPHAGEAAREATLAQNSEFLKVADGLMAALSLKRDEILLHAANSYSAAFFPETHHDMIRPGILFYGYYQSEEDRVRYDQHFGFRPCLELTATPISLRQLKRGDGISYASLYHVASDQESVGVLPLGYADGIPRALSNNIAFGKYPLRGRVTMDQIVLGGIAETKPVRILGEGVPSLESWGELANSFSYEIMSHLGNRLCRLLV